MYVIFNTTAVKCWNIEQSYRDYPLSDENKSPIFVTGYNQGLFKFYYL